MVLLRGKGLAMKQNGFAKKERFSHVVKRFCQEVEGLSMKWKGFGKR
jgi:hypothetical protein